MIRLARGLVALFIGAVGLFLLVPAPAGAAASSEDVLALDFTPCDPEAPTPEVPGRGLTGFFESEPKNPPPPEDPFAPKSNTTIYEQYGYAGLRWTTYDLGCAGSAQHPDAIAGTALANWLYLVPKVGVAFTNAVVEVAFRPTFLSVFDPLVSSVSDALYRTIFTDWVPVVLLATGLLLVWRARRANLASSTAAVGWALLVLVIATALFRWPVEAGRVADASVTATLTAVNGGLTDKSDTKSTSEKRATSNAHESLLYNSWLAGTFGQANSDTAKIYGPELFDATALTWREARIMREDPRRGEQIVEGKKKKYAEVAEKIKKADPDAYEYLTGKRSESRVGYAMLATFGALCTLPFLFGAALLVLASFLIVRFGVMLFPAFATLGIFPSMRQVVTGVGNTVAAAVVNAVMFGVAAAVMLRGIGLLLNPQTPLPHWLALTLMLLVSVVMWFVTKPVRRLRTMVHSRRESAEEIAVVDSSAGNRGERRGRHARREDRHVSEDDAPADNSQSRSETHTITEAEPSAGLPTPFRFEPPMPVPTLSPGTTGAEAPAVAASAGAGQLTGRASTPSANGSRPAPQEATPMAEFAREPRDEPSLRSSAPPEAARVGSPATPPHRYVGGDGAHVPPLPRPNTEEGGGPIYVPDRLRAANGNGASADAARMRVEEFAGPVYRPRGPGRAPSETDE